MLKLLQDTAACRMYSCPKTI